MYFSQRQDTIDEGTPLEHPGPTAVMPLEGVPGVTPLDAYQLPGKGTPREDCGQLHHFGCSDCGHVFLAERKCDQKTCPNCWRRWAFKLGKRAGLRAWAAKKLIMGRRKGRLVHCVISMKYEGGEINEYRKRAYRYAMEHQISGGAAVFHHTRDDSETGLRVPDGYVHYHIVGLAERGILPGTETDYIFHVIRDSVRGDYKGFQRTKEVIACLSYLLTHSAVKGKTHALTWFGKMSYNKLNNETLEKEFPDMMNWLGKSGRICPCCGGDDCHSLWDAEMMIERNEYENTSRPALALELYGLEVT